MTDLHSHVLPEMDDGSRSLQESVEMLNLLARQKIVRVAATPHFYANDESVSEFLERRKLSFERLKKELTPEMPEMLLGAEVRYYEGLSRLDGLKSLCIQGTRILLIEMPERKWSEYAVRELVDIASNRRIIPVLAHIERCIFHQSSETFGRLLTDGVMMQINAEFLNGFFSRTKALRLIQKGQVHFIGSDCHNMRERAPDIGRAYETLRKKLGEDFSSDFIGFANNLFDNTENISKG